MAKCASLTDFKGLKVFLEAAISFKAIDIGY